jgi:hypothetical protein
VYHSVKPDDPSFPPIYANLVEVEGGYPQHSWPSQAKPSQLWYSFSWRWFPISTPSLAAQGEQRPSFFNIRRDIPYSSGGLTK